MYQFALVKMLHNTKENRFHPIFYLDSPFPGPVEKQTIMRYKSKGHHPSGFATREEAVQSAIQLESQLKEQGDTVAMEIEPEADMLWDGNEMPIDIQLRPLPSLHKSY